MKSESDVENRLKALRLKLVKRHVLDSQRKFHLNCVHNAVHVPRGNKSRRSETVNTTMAPRKQVTLLIIQEEKPLHLCMYGSSRPDLWPGNICDDDKTSEACPLFRPLTSPEQARDEFLSLLADDEYVMENHRDLAALQWVLSSRIYKTGLGPLDSFIVWMHILFVRACTRLFGWREKLLARSLEEKEDVDSTPPGLRSSFFQEGTRSQPILG